MTEMLGNRVRAAGLQLVGARQLADRVRVPIAVMFNHVSRSHGVEIIARRIS